MGRDAPFWLESALTLPRGEEPLADGMMNHSGVNVPISCVRIIIPPSIIYNCLATGAQSLIQMWIRLPVHHIYRRIKTNSRSHSQSLETPRGWNLTHVSLDSGGVRPEESSKTNKSFWFRSGSELVVWFKTHWHLLDYVRTAPSLIFWSQFFASFLPLPSCFLSLSIAQPLPTSMKAFLRWKSPQGAEFPVLPYLRSKE